jgi:AcrR family transcriptional regulator
MGRHPQPERRAALLELCADDLLANGFAGSTLARLAAGAGTSPRMLVYHFQTRDRLVREALLQARQRQRTLYGHALEPVPGVPYSLVLRQAWSTITQPPARPYLRLFGELHGRTELHVLWPEYRALSVLDWLPVIESGLRADGDPAAPATATMLVALARGLLSDLTINDDLDRTTAGWLAAIDLLDRPARPTETTRTVGHPKTGDHPGDQI